ncbi:MAG: hypothetical protein JW384_01966 [Nitrosomonadaceae bacterium]|nr:hypothetical protein [Nitrosomonadaceae bacterium]
MLIFTIRAPLSAAKSTPATTSEYVPSPPEFITLTGITLQPHATPIIPMELFPSAAMIPAACVPCPLSSDGSASPFTKS